MVHYAIVIDSLMHAMVCITPDIAFIVGDVSKYRSIPANMQTKIVSIDKLKLCATLARLLFWWKEVIVAYRGVLVIDLTPSGILLSVESNNPRPTHV